jgi:hypothetical protein
MCVGAGGERGRKVREREGEQILKGKWIAIYLWGLTVWSPVAVFLKISYSCGLQLLWQGPSCLL